MRDTEQENDVGNDDSRDSVVTQLCFSSSFLFFLSFSFFFPTSEPWNPLKPPLACLFIGKKPIWGCWSSPRWANAYPWRNELAQASWSSPRRAGFLGMKQLHCPGEPDASLGELGSRKIIKKIVFPPSLVSFCILDQNTEWFFASRCNWCQTS